MVEDYEQVKNKAVRFYQDLCQAKRVSDSCSRMEQVLTKRLNNDQITMLQSRVEEEITRAMLNMLKGKAPGPDGCTAEFYQNCWNVVGKDVIDAVSYCFENKYMYYPVKNTTTSLVPKIKKCNEHEKFSSCSLL